jgi:hypothetical protein
MVVLVVNVYGDEAFELVCVVVVMLKVMVVV